MFHVTDTECKKNKHVTTVENEGKNYEKQKIAAKWNCMNFIYSRKSPSVTVTGTRGGTKWIKTPRSG